MDIQLNPFIDGREYYTAYLGPLDTVHAHGNRVYTDQHRRHKQSPDFSSFSKHPVLNYFVPLPTDEKTSNDFHGTNFFIDPEDEELFFYGAGWGIDIKIPRKSMPGYASYLRNGKSSGGYPGTVPGAIKWMDGAEQKAVRHVKHIVHDGLIETFRSAFQHWHLKRMLYTSYQPERPSGPNEEQIQQLLQNEVALKIRDAAANMQTCANAVIELENELRRDFSKVTNFKATMAVCAKYLQGKMGVDWFIRDYFNRYHTNDLWRLQNETLDHQRKIMDFHITGEIVNHFNTASLQPVMKKYPRFAAIYHVPEITNG